MAEMLRSVCPYDCPDACGLRVQVEDGRAVAVQGDPDHLHSRGTLCPKMAHYERTVHSPRRLTTPLRRTGAKGTGTFAPVTWDEALDEIVTRWRDLIDRHGAECILPYSYAGTMGLVQRHAGHPFFHRLGASRLERTICMAARGAGIAAVLGSTPGPDPAAVETADLVVLWGTDALSTNLHGFQRVREARRRGAKLWVVDTWRTRTAEQADEVVLVRPGSDGALAAGLMHLLLAEGRIDRDFLAAHAQGFEAFAAEVLPAWTPAVVAERTGVPEDRLRDLAAAYGAAANPQIQLGGGFTRYANGAMTTRLVLCLPTLVGAWLKPAGGAFVGTSTAPAFAMDGLLREDLQPRPTRILNMNRLGEALGPGTDPPVRSLFVYASNPAAVAPDQNAVRAGLAREDLFTVVHERFLTDTARAADLVLPATSSLEHADLYRAYGHYGVQRSRPLLPPVGESRSNWRVFQDLAARLGFAEPLFRQSEDEVIDGLLAGDARWWEGVDRGALAEGRAVRLTVPGLPPPFRTPSGRVEILNPREPEPLPRPLPCHGDGDPLPLSLVTAPALEGLNSTFHERDDLAARRTAATLLLAPAEAGSRGIADGDPVLVRNGLGRVRFRARVTGSAPPGVAVAQGVGWLEFAEGDATVNALTSQRLSDRGAGSTFYDNKVEVERG